MWCFYGGFSEAINQLNSAVQKQEREKSKLKVSNNLSMDYTYVQKSTGIQLFSVLFFFMEMVLLLLQSDLEDAQERVRGLQTALDNSYKYVSTFIQQKKNIRWYSHKNHLKYQ